MKRLQPEILNLIVNEIFLGIGVFDQQTHLAISANRLFREYVGLQADQDISKFSVESLYPPQGHERFRPFDKDFLAAEGLSQDVIVMKQDGQKLIADIGIRRVQHDSENLIIIMMRDVTLQKKLQRDLTAKQDEIQKAYQEMLVQNSALKELDRAKDKFIALTTHELRTPLSAMIATAEVLALKFYDTDEQRDEFIKTIYSEGQHLLEIVNDILDFSKIQAGKMDFFVGHHDVRPIAEKLIHHFEHMAAGKEVTLRISCEQAQAFAYLDPLRFRQAFSNVVNNAIKFTHPKTEVVVKIEADGDTMKVMVIDQGPGIAQESINKVFNEFETVGNVNTHHKGTGLGMPITKKIMENMGGSIQLTSELGKGACFAMNIPLKKVLAEDLYRDRPSEADDLAA